MIFDYGYQSACFKKKKEKKRTLNFSILDDVEV